MNTRRGLSTLHMLAATALVMGASAEQMPDISGPKKSSESSPPDAEHPARPGRYSPYAGMIRKFVNTTKEEQRRLRQQAKLTAKKAKKPTSE